MSEAAKTRLDNAIKSANEYGESPKHGKIVEQAYRDGEIQNLTDALFIIAELLDG